MVSVISSQDAEVPFRKRTVRGVPLFVAEQALDVMLQAADEGYMDGNETMGLLIGNFYIDDDGIYAIVRGTATSKLIADRFRVEFDSSEMGSLIDAVDSMKNGECIVGWYHSHLGFGCFMSETDVRSQHSVFGTGTGFAMVIDPVKGELAVFDNSEVPEKVQMIVME